MVRRRLFGSPSPLQSAAEEPPYRSPTVPATTLDLSTDRSRSPSVEGRPDKGHADLPPVRPADLPSPFLAADVLYAPIKPVFKKQAPVLSGQQRRTRKLAHTSLTRHAKHARQRSPDLTEVSEIERQRSPAAAVPELARQRSPAAEVPDKARQCSPMRQCSPTRQCSPARQRSPACQRATPRHAHQHSPTRQHSPAKPPTETPPRDRSIPVPPEGVSDSAAISQQPWFEALIRAVTQAVKPVLSDLVHKSLAASTPLSRKRGVSDTVTSPRTKLSPCMPSRQPPPPRTFSPSPSDENYPSSGESREVGRSPIAPMRETPPCAGKSSWVGAEKSLPPSLLESCIPPRRKSKDSKTVPKYSSRLKMEPASHSENVRESPQEEPLGTGDFAASPSRGELQESEHAFWQESEQVLTLMRTLNGFADPEIPPREVDEHETGTGSTRLRTTTCCTRRDTSYSMLHNNSELTIIYYQFLCNDLPNPKSLEKSKSSGLAETMERHHPPKAIDQYPCCISFTNYMNE
ncbi:serine/arginine repetitive matrix protein 1-like [Palaemon carinicauda]|uniref:serine/arginine repetitive matrix protein 1-like n=1 Tax=Palaemon carinicauda TaxID=392227 RepID=UPI0035B60347